MVRSELINEVNGVKGVLFLHYLERFDEILSLKMFEEFYDDLTCVHFCITTGFVDTTLVENIAEGDNVAKVFVKFDFANSAHNVALKRGVHEGVADGRNVKQCGVVGEQLLTVLGDFHEGRNAVEVDGRGVIAVDDSIEEVSGQNGRAFVSLVVVVECGVDA